MPDIISNIICDFAIQVRNLLGNKLSKIILYGSYARGDYQNNSDADIMILVKDMSNDEIRVVEETLCDFAFDMELETGLHISALIENEQHFESWERTLPFFANVRKEGVVISDK